MILLYEIFSFSPSSSKELVGRIILPHLLPGLLPWHELTRCKQSRRTHKSFYGAEFISAWTTIRCDTFVGNLSPWPWMDLKRIKFRIGSISDMSYCTVWIAFTDNVIITILYEILRYTKIGILSVGAWNILILRHSVVCL